MRNADEFFQKHQRMLLFLLNTPIVSLWFRWVLCIDGKKSSVGKRRIIAIYPHAITWKRGRKHITEFRIHQKFAKRIYYAFLPLWYVLHAWDMVIANTIAPTLNLGFDSTGPLYPAAGANDPVDGRVFRAGVNETFGTIRGGAGTGFSVTDSIESSLLFLASATTNQYSQLRRSIYCFNTSVIGAGNTVTAATFSLVSNSKLNGLGSADFHLAGATPAATNNLQNSDYGQCQTTSFGNIAYASWNTDNSTYNDISLNASGLSNISVTADSKFSTQLSWDINNNFTGSWVSGERSAYDTYYADQTGTSKDPKLVVTYTVPVAAADYLAAEI